MAEAKDSIIFVVDGPGLGAQSLLLAASLAKHHPDRSQVALIAYVSPRSIDSLSEVTRALYAQCGVQMRPLPSAEGIWAKPYPHGNKILACAAPRASQRSLFIDTDTVCLGPLTGLDLADPHAIAAVPEGLPTWGKEPDKWPRAYEFFGLPLPTDRVTLTRGRQLEYLPYFNAGFISFSDVPRPGSTTNFAQDWLQTAIAFDQKCPIKGKRPWLDQITLPLTMKRFGYGYEALHELWNFSIADRVKLSRAKKARLIHYHRFVHLKRLDFHTIFIADALGCVPAVLAEALLAQISSLVADPVETAAA
ncbi:hypothetical protein [Cypionkella sp.]|uniref:hypothetical protein n=1 Tax=Cypionkella sp. TaxID=2811411 RepID=UPI002AB9F16D|nr:hypothetical protein [Cypionkella sp.]MDZ4391348.1 hypothetical protein [Cypionkella sp.]